MVRLFQIANGLGAGNIGDDLMAFAFWDALPPHITLDVAVFADGPPRRKPYPERHRYVPVIYYGNESEQAGKAAGLLVGDTPVTEAEGLHWPLEFLAPRLEYFHKHSLPVDAVGVGVDRLLSAAGRELFRRCFLPIRSWTVRSSRCREALLDLGVAESRIVVGADWSWLYRVHEDRQEWAKAIWRGLGADPEKPLLVVNVVHLIWQSLTDVKKAIAAALDELSAHDGLQIAFFANEARPGEFFDAEAARSIQALMKEPSVRVPNQYYSPDETLSMLSYATATVSERYHFTVESVLAGTVPVNIARGQKMAGLIEELGLAAAGSIEQVSADELVEAVRKAVEQRERLLKQLDLARRHLAARATNNLTFVRHFYDQS